MDETAEARRIRLHAEVDAEYSPLAKEMSKFHWLAAKDVFDLWRDEKIHVDKFGQRFPKVVNIQIPTGSY
jgi:hypothetical protein